MEEGINPQDLQAPARDVTQEEYQEMVDEAFLADRKIKETIIRTREDWWELAARFHDFHELQRWKALGHDHLSDWLGQSEIGYSRSTFDELWRLWEQLIVLRGVSVDDIKDIDWTKASIAVRAMRAGRVPLQQALSDARSLSQSDLIEEYVKKPKREKEEKEPDSQSTVNPDEVKPEEPVKASDVEPKGDDEPRYGHFDEPPELVEVSGVVIGEDGPEEWFRCPSCSALHRLSDFVSVSDEELAEELGSVE